jgi:hypothetical protein
MKWPIYLHSWTSRIGSSLSKDHNILYRDLLKTLNKYLEEYSLKEDLMRDFLNGWNRINLEKHIPVLKCIIKYLRHRLLVINTVLFHRIIHLFNGMIRNSRTIAQMLFGGEKFLRTLAYLIPVYLKRKEILGKETATFALKCLVEFTLVFKDRPDVFPHYERITNKLVLLNLPLVELPNFLITTLENCPVVLDPNTLPLDPGDSSTVVDSFKDGNENESSVATPDTSTTMDQFESESPSSEKKPRIRSLAKTLSSYSQPQQQNQEEITISSPRSSMRSNKRGPSPYRVKFSARNIVHHVESFKAENYAAAHTPDHHFDLDDAYEVEDDDEDSEDENDETSELTEPLEFDCSHKVNIFQRDDIDCGSQPLVKAKSSPSLFTPSNSMKDKNTPFYQGNKITQQQSTVLSHSQSMNVSFKYIGSQRVVCYHH